jgi:hypothetical protein
MPRLIIGMTERVAADPIATPTAALLARDATKMLREHAPKTN